MANSDIALDMENPKEKAEATLPAENPKEKVTSSKDTKEGSAVEENHESNFWSPKPMVDENPKKEKYWKFIFVASCFCGVLADPLFLYVPIIKDDVKCLFLEQKLKIIAVILRSVTDLFYILDIIFRIFGFENYSVEQLCTPYRFLRSRLIGRSCVPTSWRSCVPTLIDILAILPLPQMYMQMQMQIETAERAEENRKLQVILKTEQFGPHIESWLSKNGIPTKSHEEMKLQVMEKVQQSIEWKRDVNLDNLLHSLPSDFQRRIKKCTPLTKLKEVFNGLDEVVLKTICKLLKPMKFKKNDIIIEDDKPLKMVFIVDGLVDIEKRNSDGSCNNSQRGAGELCGQDLLCGSKSNGEYAKASGDVEALVIMAEDMERVRFRFREQIDAYERSLCFHTSEMPTRHKVKMRLNHFTDLRRPSVKK